MEKFRNMICVPLMGITILNVCFCILIELIFFNQYKIKMLQEQKLGIINEISIIKKQIN